MKKELDGAKSENMDQHHGAEHELSPEIIWEDRLARYYHRRIKGKLLAFAVGFFSILLLSLCHLIFKPDDFSGKIPENYEHSAKKSFLDTNLVKTNKEQSI